MEPTSLQMLSQQAYLLMIGSSTGLIYSWSGSSHSDQVNSDLLCAGLAQVLQTEQDRTALGELESLYHDNCGPYGFIIVGTLHC
jgi:hypothetical protein